MDYVITRIKEGETDELMHFGVKGMKWGVRRNQNKDGSLTSAGQNRYKQMSDDKLQKELYKQVKKARTEQTNWSNKWNVNNTIGENSKKAQDRYNRDLKAYKESESYKKAEKKIRDLNRKADEGKIDIDKYDTEYEKIIKSVYKPELDTSVVIGSKGRTYSKAYLDTYGKELNIGYLKDLGYDDKTAKEFTERILKSNKKLLNGM